MKKAVYLAHPCAISLKGMKKIPPCIFFIDSFFFEKTVYLAHPCPISLRSIKSSLLHFYNN